MYFYWGASILMNHFNHNKLTIALLSITATLSSSLVKADETKPVQQLETIVVTASGFEQDIKNAPASISIVSQEDIEKKNASSIADLLSDVPGIDIRNGVGKTANLSINMRGMDSNYTLILIDGRRQTTTADVTPNGFSNTFSGYLPPVSAIERIEVIRGPMATRYGSEALGGVINIITKKTPDNWSGAVSVSGNMMENKDEADSIKTDFIINGPIITDTLGVQLRGSYLDRDKSERIPGSSGRDPRPNEADIYDFGGKLSFNLNDQNQFWVDGSYASQVYTNDDNRLGTQDVPGRARGYKDELEFNREQVSIGHDGDYNFGEWHTYVSQVNTETVGRTIPTGTFNTNDAGGYDRNLKNSDLVVDSHIIAPISNHRLTLGLEYKDTTIEDDIAGIGSEFNQDSMSIYAEDEWALLDNLLFTFGGRYEDHSGFGGQFSPRGYLVWNTSDQITLKGGVSTGYRVPSAKALHNGIINVSGQGTNYGVGSPNLKPEESTNYELSANFNNGENLDLTTTAFFTKITDRFTDGADIPNCNFTADPNRAGCVSYGDHITQEYFSGQINSDEAESKGVEVSLKYTVIPEWDIKAAYTYMDTEITKGANKGNQLSNVPKNAFNMTSTWYVNENIDVWLQHEYKSSRVRSEATPAAGSDAETIYNLTGNKLKGYNLFNLGGSISITDNLRANAAVNNLLDKDFTANQTYTTTAGDEASVYDYLSLGRSVQGTYIPERNYWLSLTYNF